MGKRMKRYRSSIPFIVLILAMVSVACSLFTRGIQETQETPEPNFEPVTDQLVIEPAALPEAQLGEPYEVRIIITENVTPVGDMAITNGALPEGLEVVFTEGEDSATISGIPKEAGTFTVALYIWCYGTQVSGQTLEKEYTLVVKE